MILLHAKKVTSDRRGVDKWMIRVYILLITIVLVKNRIYLHSTNDGLDIELYDCVLAQSLFYCRRPKEPVHLTRENDNDGLLHEFSELESKQITVSTVLHQ